MAQIKKPHDVFFLALEGGGGKGVTYLGAIRALENLGVLPINIDKPFENQIRGISGASAGAIAAMFLAMGYTSFELEKVLSNPETFNSFFDGPSYGGFRAVDKENKPRIRAEATPENSLLKNISTVNAITSIVSPIAHAIVKDAIERKMHSTDPIIARFNSSPKARMEYVKSILFHRGMFPGFAVREFLQGEVYRKLYERLLLLEKKKRFEVPTFAEMNFRNFYKVTGVDLVITGANITKHKPAIFSRRHTPEFPVAEAVGISMNLPLIFQPVYVEANVPEYLEEFPPDDKRYNTHNNKYNTKPDDYHGFWVDGGLLNNFPLHAFDFRSPQVSSQYPDLKPLNRHILGLRLTEGPHKQTSQQQAATSDVLLGHLADILGTVLYPSEEGQIRSQDERDQTIDLYTYDLSTTEFAPHPDKRKKPITEAEDAVYKYFGTFNPRSRRLTELIDFLQQNDTRQ
jgi:NTE family protein